MGASASASARSGALVLSVAVSGTALRVALANAGEETLRAYFAVQSANGVFHDFLMVELSGAAARTLRFTGDRDASTTGLAVLDPGEEVADTLDLAAWARAPGNGAAPLAPGAYELSATYRVDQDGVWSGAVTAGPVALQVPGT